jgi:hypothetical protein
MGQTKNAFIEFWTFKGSKPRLAQVHKTKNVYKISVSMLQIS